MLVSFWNEYADVAVIVPAFDEEGFSPALREVEAFDQG